MSLFGFIVRYYKKKSVTVNSERQIIEVRLPERVGDIFGG